MPKRERTIMIVASGALAVFLVSLFLTYQRQTAVQESLGETVLVWQSAQPIPAFTVITRDMVRQVEIPRRYVYTGLLIDDDELIGRVSVVQVPADTIMVSTHLRAPDSRDVALTRVTLTKGLQMESGLVPGDLALLVASYRDGDKEVTRIILRDARVVAVDSQGREHAVSILVPLPKLEEVIRIHDFGRAIHISRMPVEG